MEIEIEIWYSAPGSGIDVSKLLKGEKIWIYSEAEGDQIEDYAHPVEYKELETRLVSNFFRDLPFYAGYSIPLSTKTLNEKFKLIDKDYNPE